MSSSGPSIPPSAAADRALPVPSGGAVSVAVPNLSGTTITAAPLATRPSPSATSGLAFSTFLTDGVIARLCDELARLAGVPIWLRDASGQVIIPVDPGASATGEHWRIVDHETGASRAFALVNRPYNLSNGVFVAPLHISAGEIASIVMPADWGIDDPIGRKALESAVTLVASTAAELCEDQLALRRRVGELDALFRLSSLLVRAGEPDDVLRAALDLAIDVLRVDAGTISLLDRDLGGGGSVTLGERYEGPLHHRASRHLSAAWLADSASISAGGLLRTRALAGEVVAIPDIRHDPLIKHDAQTRARQEGLVSLLTTGLIFQGRAWGLIRLYSRAVRTFTTQERGLLRSIADQAAMALSHARLRKLREEDQKIKRQLQLAADVQRRMLPERLPIIEPFDIAARYTPSFHLGGDFYDAFIRDGSLVLSVCDVVGKGVPAALLMSAVRASLRAFAQEITALDQVVERLNVALARDTLESEFATLWLGIADPRTLRLSYCGAGHDPPLIFHNSPAGRAPALSDIEELTAGGMALGIDPSQRYELGSFDLRPGDVLIAYTDGLSEATNFENKKFGRERISASVLGILTANPSASAAQIVEHLIRDLRTFCGLRSVHDDVTLVVMRVRQNAASAASSDDLISI